MKIAVIGLGIIGGSFCKAIKKHTDHTVIGINRTHSVAEQAKNDGSIDVIGKVESLGEADIIFLCMYPQACVDFIKENGKFIKKGALVTDSSGIKSAICPQLYELSQEFGFVFVGSHPMAGKEKNGYGVSEAELYKGASFIITPCGADEKYVNTLADLALSIGFGKIKITTPEEHDRMIAFTSQLPHVLACSYVLSPCCPNHNGFSAGSYRDVSRVANINSKLWSELFLENREPLITELDILIDNITRIKDAIKDNDRETLADLLEQGHKIKQALGE
ncbi:MAG: prephenate dehydrogenase [Ruminococcus sp.]|nr:prephenate dehydrogenase [Ruminococcus sp.]